MLAIVILLLFVDSLEGHTDARTGVHNIKENELQSRPSDGRLHGDLLSRRAIPQQGDNIETTSTAGTLQETSVSSGGDTVSSLGSSSSSSAINDGGDESSESTEPQLGKWKGVVVALYLLGILYTFLALAIVCDDYFADSLEVISARLHLSPSVAGATFMAAGSSAPELFTSLADAIGTKSDIGPATIAGSAVFNLLVIPGLSAALTGRSLRLDWRPIMRDSVFYGMSILLVGLFILSGNRVDWWEALILLAAYAAYIGWMMRDDALLLKFCGPSTVDEGPDDQDQLLEAGGVQMKAIENDEESSAGSAAAAKEEDGEVSQSLNVTQDDAGDLQEEGPPSRLDRVISFFAAPLNFLFQWTVPRCTDGKERLFLVSFAGCVIWIGLFTYAMVQMANQVGELVHIHPSVMGLVVLAVGTSVPDTMASVVVAKKGEGDMAVSNAIGSNVFDMLLGLGLPWLTSCILFGSSVRTHEEGASGPVIVALAQLALLLVIFLLLLRFNKWVLTPKVGYVLFALYIVYVTVNIAAEISRD